jgi:tyrosyl-tRNA synthetase
VIFTKVLSLADHTFRNFAELVTRWPQSKIDEMLAEIEAGTLNPQEAKAQLAWEIVSIFHGDEAADQAAEDARRMFEGDIPSDAPEHTISGAIGLLDLMNEAGLTRSNSEARRLVQQGGVRLNGETVEDAAQEIAHTPGKDQVLQVGKRRYLRIRSG